MGRKRWAERRRPPAPQMLVAVDEVARFRPGVLQCGFPMGDGCMCMTPAGQCRRHAPAGSGAPGGEMSPSLYRELTGRPYPPAVRAETTRRPTYAVLREAAAERAQFTPDQAQTMLSAALGTRPHLAARVIGQLGPVLAGELARAVDAALEQRYGNYLRAERETLDRLYDGAVAKLRVEQEKRGRSASDERWTTPSRLS